jgi:hypothetical protein
MTNKVREIFDLIHPECETIQHEVGMYRGLEQVDAISVPSALEKGFIPIREHCNENTTELIFIREEDLPKLDQLISKIAILRAKQAEQLTLEQQEINIQAAKQRWKQLKPQLSVDPTIDLREWQELENYVLSAHKPEQLDLSQLQAKLSSWRQMSHSGNHAHQPNLATTATEISHTMSLSPGNAVNRTDRIQNMTELWSLLDYRALAHSELHDICEYTRPEEILQLYYNAINKFCGTIMASNSDCITPPQTEVAAPDTSSSAPPQTEVNDLSNDAISEDSTGCEAANATVSMESLLSAQCKPNQRADMQHIAQYFCEQLQSYRLRCEMRREKASWSKELRDYYDHHLCKDWKQKEEQWTELYHKYHREELPNEDLQVVISPLERILTLYHSKIHRYVYDYWGEEELDRAKAYLLDLFAQCEERVSAGLMTLRQRSVFRETYAKKADIANYFEIARSIKRQIMFFCGPTNSGKTHAAFNELAQSNSGSYLAPLRLMALEGQAQLRERGIRASFITGEERVELEGAKFVSSTIEMLSYRHPVGCVIIDEIQLIEHSQRGWAWTNALIGAPTYKLILTGSVNALPIVRKICEYLQEPLEVRYFERFNPLEVLPQPSSISALEPATAIICFSRRDVFEIKRQVEAQTPYRVATIYGSLAPDVRRREARRFREGHAQILVATDAIGMGLNLPIRTVLFWTLEKISQGMSYHLQAGEIQQIAGRAGRYGFTDRGFVGAFSADILETIAQAMKKSLPDIEGPCAVMPMPLHIEMISEILHTQDLPQLLNYFEREVWFSQSLFYPCVTNAMHTLAEELREPLDNVYLNTKFTFARAPVPARSRHLLDALRDLAYKFAQGETLSLAPDMIKPYLKTSAPNDGLLREAEEQVKLLTVYRWLAYRYPDRFIHAQQADTYRYILNRYIANSLSHNK